MISVSKNGQLVKSGNLFKKIICRILGHKFKTTRRISASIVELRCPRCGKEFAIHTQIESLLPLDKDLIKLHNDILLEKP